MLLGEEPAWSEARDVVAWYRPLEEQYQSLTTSLLATGAVVAWTDLPYFTFIDHPEVRDEQRLDTASKDVEHRRRRHDHATLGAVTVDFASHLNAPDGSIDLAARPDGVHLSAASVHTAVNTWFGPGVREAYAAARGELGIADDSHARERQSGTLARPRRRRLDVVEPRHRPREPRTRAWRPHGRLGRSGSRVRSSMPCTSA